MRKLLIFTIFVLFSAGQAWGDCAWVLVEQKKYPEQLVSAPFLSVTPYSYYETQKECLKGKETTLAFESIVQEQKFVAHMKAIVRKDEKGREAYYRYDCIPSNVLTLFIRAEQ
jgi:hypothetical protein